MERKSTFRQWLDNLVFTRDATDTAGEIVGAVGEAAVPDPKSPFRNLIDGILWCGTTVLTTLTDAVQAWAPLSYFVCFAFGVLVIPPLARRLTGWARWITPYRASANATSGRESDRSAPTLVDLPSTGALGNMTARLDSFDEHLSQQRASLDASIGSLNEKFITLEGKLNDLSTKSELGEAAHKAIHGFLMIRVIGYQVKHLKGYIDSVRGYLSSPTDGQIGSSYNQLNTIRFNLHRIAEYLQNNGVHGAVDLRSTIRDVEYQRKEQISFENSSGVSEREKYERERARLLNLLETVYLAVDRAKKHYRQLYLAPRMKED